jgi:hypothetical protein
MDADQAMQRSNRRARRGRRIARLILAEVVSILAIGAFILMNQPNSMGGSAGDPSNLFIPGIGVAGLVVGLIWMAQTLRADPEPDARAWRYRAR